MSTKLKKRYSTIRRETSEGEPEKEKEEKPGFVERTLKWASPYVMVLHLVFTGFMVKRVYFTNQDIPIHTPADFQGIQEAGWLAAATLEHVEAYIKPGVHTEALDDVIAEYVTSHDATNAPLNYRGFPKSSCISVNQVALHGVPSKQTVLKKGDVVSIDVAVLLNGWYADTARTFLVGGHAQQLGERMVKANREALDLAVAACMPGITTGYLARVIQEHAKVYGFEVMEDFGGHGIGRKLHQLPVVSHADAAGGSDTQLLPGYVFTLEPIFLAGHKNTTRAADGWSVTTDDGALASHFEHTVGVTESHCRVFTEAKKERPEDDELEGF